MELETLSSTGTGSVKVTTTSPTGARHGVVTALIDWMVKRGVLFVLLLSPIAALFLGLLRIVPTRLGYVVLPPALIVLPVWVWWRRRVSRDRDEPAFHVHRYALYALFPYVVFSVVRFPVFYLFDFSYWAPWYTFGSGATGAPVGQFSSLLPGAVLYSLQGMALSMGFYTLFKRHNLLNATLYFTLFISSLYSYIFPVFLLVGAKPAFTFHLVNFWAHCWMALTAVFVPVFFQRIWPGLRATVRVAAVGGLAVVWLAPYAFAFGYAQFWQFPRERALEHAAFDRIVLGVDGVPTVTVSGGQAHYRLAMRFGPRDYTTYAHVHKLVNAEGVRISGVLASRGVQVAICTAGQDTLASTRGIRDPEKYFPVYAQLTYVTIPVICTGEVPAEIPADAQVTFTWAATATLHGERETVVRQYAGSTQHPLRHV